MKGMAGIGEAASIIAVIQIGERILTVCGRYIQEVKDAKEDIEKLSNEIEALNAALGLLKSTGIEPDQLSEVIRGCLASIKELEEKLSSYERERSRFSVSRKLKWPFSSRDVAKSVEALNRSKSTILLYIEAAKQTDRNIQGLQCCHQAVHDSWSMAKKARCLTTTRKELLHQIKAWIEDKGARNRYIFWLRGMAGTGKSTISLTIADDLARNGKLGASFFFPGIAHLIGAAMTQNPTITEKGVTDQWKVLVLQPMVQFDKTLVKPRSMVFVLDALDECDEEDDVQRVVSFLPMLCTTMKMLKVRVFLTSRPEVRLRMTFDALSIRECEDFVLHNIEKDIVDSDIRSYFSFKFEGLKQKGAVKAQDWPGDAPLSSLVDRSCGLFIYAATVCRFIEESRERWSDPQEALSVLLDDSGDKEQDPQESPTYGLDTVYIQILTSSMTGKSAAIYKRFRRFIGPIVLTLETLAVGTLERLLGFKEGELHISLNRLNAVLDITVSDNGEQLIRLLHPSFRDFLMDPKRCPAGMVVHQNEGHESILTCCLAIMSSQLKKDICRLEALDADPRTLPPDVVNKYISSELRYSCKHWIEHLIRGNICLSDNGAVHLFLKKYLLQWIEVLSILGKDVLAGGIQKIVQMEANATYDLHISDDLQALIRDAKRFLWYFQEVLEFAPLQLYCGALIFAPSESKVRSHFKDQIPSYILKHSSVRKHWDAILFRLKCDKYYLEKNSRVPVRACLAFSPDNKRLALFRYDNEPNTLYIWDTTTGAQIVPYLNVTETYFRHRASDESYEVSVYLHPGGKLISFFDSWGVCVWDYINGVCLRELQHSRPVFGSMCVSPNGKLLVLVLKSGSVFVWDHERYSNSDEYVDYLRNRSLQAPDSSKIAYAGNFSAPTFSPDGTRFATLDLPVSMQLVIWDTSLETPIHSINAGTILFIGAEMRNSARLEGVAICMSSSRIMVAVAVRDVCYSKYSYYEGYTYGALAVWDSLTGDLVNCVTFFYSRVVELGAGSQLRLSLLGEEPEEVGMRELSFSKDCCQLRFFLCGRNSRKQRLMTLDVLNFELAEIKGLESTSWVQGLRVSQPFDRAGLCLAPNGRLLASLRDYGEPYQVAVLDLGYLPGLASTDAEGRTKSLKGEDVQMVDPDRPFRGPQSKELKACHYFDDGRLALLIGKDDPGDIQHPYIYAEPKARRVRVALFDSDSSSQLISLSSWFEKQFRMTDDDSDETVAGFRLCALHISTNRQQSFTITENGTFRAWNASAARPAIEIQLELDSCKVENAQFSPSGAELAIQLLQKEQYDNLHGSDKRPGDVPRDPILKWIRLCRFDADLEKASGLEPSILVPPGPILRDYNIFLSTNSERIQQMVIFSPDGQYLAQIMNKVAKRVSLKGQAKVGCLIVIWQLQPRTEEVKNVFYHPGNCWFARFKTSGADWSLLSAHFGPGQPASLFDIGCGTSNCVQLDPEAFFTFVDHEPDLVGDGSWITHRGRRAIWIPYEFRPARVGRFLLGNNGISLGVGRSLRCNQNFTVVLLQHQEYINELDASRLRWVVEETEEDLRLTGHPTEEEESSAECSAFERMVWLSERLLRYLGNNSITILPSEDGTVPPYRIEFS
ncbi:hypothetical protein BJ508DRAFT_367432 [Ascobolus immersus RN42]|uniref:NACHT domain-containing protein n=1 Tax=Ascobolus immersus RN42 TaxID=1160509 RepID=A0A3N4HIR3_ASCIM|nr:hypothetical protein BJ508DRAFT_367432 [Ascobolus immersus RN42]